MHSRVQAQITGILDAVQSYRSNVADNASFEQWQAEGSRDAARRANEQWKRMLAEYEPPAADDAVDEELREWIERKKASFPDSNT